MVVEKNSDVEKQKDVYIGKCLFVIVLNVIKIILELDVMMGKITKIILGG